jgi:hypothetical protein
MGYEEESGVLYIDDGLGQVRIKFRASCAVHTIREMSGIQARNQFAPVVRVKKCYSSTTIKPQALLVTFGWRSEQ